MRTLTCAVILCFAVSGTNLFAGTYGGRVWHRPLSEMTPLTPDWISQSSGVSINLWGVKAVSANVAWACGESGIVLRTTDGGATWTTVASRPSTLTCWSIETLDAYTAWVVTANNSSNSALYKTTNGGSTWTQQLASVASGSSYSAVRFYDADNGIMLGDPEDGYFVIYTTTNGGTTWTRTSQSSIPAPMGQYTDANNLAIFGNSAWFGA